jgi:hypothetical protein
MIWAFFAILHGYRSDVWVRSLLHPADAWTLRGLGVDLDGGEGRAA